MQLAQPFWFLLLVLGVQMLLLFSDTIFIAERVMEKGVEEGKEDLQ